MGSGRNRTTEGVSAFAWLEAVVPGLATLSSGHALVRSADGVCLLHDRLINGWWQCTSFTRMVEASLAD
jgi:hypothetical protein